MIRENSPDLSDKIREVIVFGEQGEPRALKTFSNVPYFLVQSLEQQGILVHTVNLSIREWWQRIARRIFDNLVNRTGKTEVSYYRSKWHAAVNKVKIRKAIQRYPTADAFIFTSFSFSTADISDKPTFLFCDWDLPHFFQYLLEREPQPNERKMVDRQKVCIEAATAVFVLFPAVAARMQAHYRQPNMYYLGNVVNHLREPLPEQVSRKKANQQLLFIGNARYLNGFLRLLDAFRELKPHIPELQLHAIGISGKDLAEVPADVYLHGYLDKDRSEDREKYYELLNQSTIFINTHPKWAAFSATLEAMYFYTPIIVTDYEEFRYTFGNNIGFGHLYNEDDSLADHIRAILGHPDYDRLSQAAHRAAKVHNWPDWVAKMRKKMEALSN